MRLSMEPIEAIRGAVGPNVPIGVRLCVNEFTAFGYDESYGLRMARYPEQSGLIDYLNSDAGSYSSMWMDIPPTDVSTSDIHRINVALKKAIQLPVIAFDRIVVGEAEAILRAGETDFIGMAR